MATARPSVDRSPHPDGERPRPDPALLELGRLILEAARNVPPPWPAPDPAEDPEEPAVRRKARRRRGAA